MTPSLTPRHDHTKATHVTPERIVIRNLLPKLLVLAPTALSLTARADTILDFTLTGPSPTVTFTLPEHPFFQNTLHLVTVGTRSSGSLNGVNGYTVDLTFFTGSADFPESLILNVFSLDQTLTGSLSLDLKGSPLIFPYFGADYPAPPGDFTALLSPGRYGLYTLSATGPINYTLDVTPEATTTPEPSSLILLLTGAGGLLAASRRTPRMQ